VTTPSAGIAGVFDRAADTYDDVGVEWFTPIAQGLVDELAVQPGERVLDVGCGRGAALFPLAEATGPTGSVLGIDLAPRMVQRTAQDVLTRGLSHCKVKLADACAPELPSSSYDVVASCLVLFFLPDPGAALRAWLDLLMPGGRLGVATFGPQDPRWVAVDQLFAPYLPPAMLDARASGRRGPFASDEGMEQLLSDAGLVDGRTAHRTIEARFADAEQWHAFSWSHGQRAMWEVVPQERHEELQRQASALLERFAEADGAMSFSQEVRYTLARRR
jgi:ubiquinone/menaquinone biosynthesis C-methylase UbiE